jgi:integrase
MGSANIEALLTHLAVQEKVAASTKTRPSAPCYSSPTTCSGARSTGPDDAIRARKPTRLPTVLTTDEALQVLGALSGAHALMAKVRYGTGLRLMECLRQRD